MDNATQTAESSIDAKRSAAIPELGWREPHWRLDESLLAPGEFLARRDNGVKYVSFDFFDTLVSRLAPEPVSVFIDVGRRLAEAGLLKLPLSAHEFSQLRQVAERKARKRVACGDEAAEVTIAQIYIELAGVVSDPLKAMTIEIEAEQDFCYLNPFTWSLLLEAKQRGLRVAVLSDTYFSAEHLKSILAANGADPAQIDVLLTSSDTLMGKWNGSLFRLLLAQYSLSGNEVMHIGDNHVSDLEKPRSNGLHAFLYYRICGYKHEVFGRERRLLAGFPEPSASLDSLRVMAQRLAGREAAGDYFRDGAFLLGPVLARYADWCVGQFRQAGVTRVLALMREGMLLARMLERSAEAQGVKLEVVTCYTSRAATHLASLGHATPQELAKRLARRSATPVKKILAGFGLHDEDMDLDASLLEENLHSGNRARVLEFLQREDIRAKVEVASAERRHVALAYYDSLIDGAERVGIVDLGWGGTIQANIARILDLGGRSTRLVGCYLATGNRACELVLNGSEVRGYLANLGADAPFTDALFRSPEMLEQAVNACIGSTEGYAMQPDGRAVPVLGPFRADPAEEQRRRRLQEGILVFQQLWLAQVYPRFACHDRLSRLLGEIDRQSLALMARLIEQPTRDEALRLGGLNHDDNLGSDSWRPICDGASEHMLAAGGAADLFRDSEVYWPQGVLAKSRPDVATQMAWGWRRPSALGLLGAAPRAGNGQTFLVRRPEELHVIQTLAGQMRPEQLIVFGWNRPGEAAWLADLAGLLSDSRRHPRLLPAVVHISPNSSAENAARGEQRNGVVTLNANLHGEAAYQALASYLSPHLRSLVLIDHGFDAAVIQRILANVSERLGPDSQLLLAHDWASAENVLGEPSAQAACRQWIMERGSRATLERVPAGELPAAAERTVTVLRQRSPYDEWRKSRKLRESDLRLFAERAQKWNEEPLFHVVVPMRRGAEAGLADTLDSLATQIYPSWRLTVVADTPSPDSMFDEHEQLAWICDADHPAAAADRVAREERGDWVAIVEPGDRLAPQALYRCAEYINRQSDRRLLYSDEDIIDARGQCRSPGFKPDFNLDLLRSTAYIGNFVVAHRKALAEVKDLGRLPPVVHYDLALHVLDRFGESSIGHIADVLYHRSSRNDESVDIGAIHEQHRAALRAHLERNQIKATAEPGLFPGAHRIDYPLAERPLVSVIIPTRDRLDLLKPCLDTLLKKTSYPNLEVIVVDNDSQEPPTRTFLDTLTASDARVRVLPYPQAFNYAAINNEAARAARGDYLLLLNNDTLIVQDDWLERLMGIALRPEVGIVSPRLVFPNQRLQHAGIIAGMGVNGVAEHLHYGLPMLDTGYLGRAQLAQNFSAVTGACLLIRKSLYADVGGMDAQALKVLYNDVDLCFKVGGKGYKIVWTPHATVIHHGSGSIGKELDPAKRRQAESEMAVMLERWKGKIASDPAHNPNLSLTAVTGRVDTEMSTRWSIDPHDRPRIVGLGFGSQGSWCYRVQQPLTALDESIALQCAVLPFHKDRIRVPSVAELERLGPDVLLMHNAIDDRHQEAIARYKRFNHAFVVFGQDDLMWALPPKNPFHATVFKDMKPRVRRCLELSDRLVVSTEALAEQFRGMIDDIRVVPNYLERARWGSLHSLRRQGRKPRVGWAGAQQHAGDLEILLEVVAATANEVEWVFFGMALDDFKPYVKELHAAVKYEDYPAKLAALNLDLALAPLERNAFNESKSNLRLLEYGAMGWPVIASDIEPYRGAPVMRVPNNAQAWARAIRDCVNDLDAAQRSGDELRAWVRQHWMLEEHLADWAQALQPGTRPAGDADRERVMATPKSSAACSAM